MFNMVKAIDTKQSEVFLIFNTCTNTDEQPGHGFIKLDVETGKQILQRMLYAQRTNKLFGTVLDHIRFSDWGATYFDNSSGILEEVNAGELEMGGDGVVVESFNLLEEDDHRLDASYMVCDDKHFWFEATDSSSDEPFCSVYFDLKFLLAQMGYLGWNGRFESVQGNDTSIGELSF